MTADKKIYFPGLNGMRAIAAIAVVISHITVGLKEFNLDPFIFGVFADGNPKGLYLAGYGVSIFFVLSGFLITYLLEEEELGNGIDIKKFYIRRILRIWPLYYMYLLLALILILFYGLDINIKSLCSYIFFAANVPFILETGLPFLGHYWSLGVEEQFYLFWPWVIKKINYLVSVIIILIIILIGFKIVLHIFYPHCLLEKIIHVTRFHCMMIGGLGAVLYRKNNNLFLIITDNKLTQLICWVIILLVAVNKFHVASFLDNEIISVVALFIIIGQIKIKNRIINLELGVFDFLGKISYGIYVIHPMLILLFSKIFFDLDISLIYKYLIVYSVILISTIGVSYLSFAYFEKFFLNLKQKFVVIKSSASKNH